MLKAHTYDTASESSQLLRYGTIQCVHDQDLSDGAVYTLKCNCQMSNVKCQMSNVKCQMSNVKCQMSTFIVFNGRVQSCVALSMAPLLRSSQELQMTARLLLEADFPGTSWPESCAYWIQHAILHQLSQTHPINFCHRHRT
eukprot:COSAG02_NODE_14133_length_1306_cov_1.369511_2_plen_141_part_00